MKLKFIDNFYPLSGITLDYVPYSVNLLSNRFTFLRDFGNVEYTVDGCIIDEMNDFNFAILLEYCIVSSIQ